jgi:hypothetical protein
MFTVRDTPPEREEKRRPGEGHEMKIRGLMPMTRHRRKMAILSLLTFLVLC